MFEVILLRNSHNSYTSKASIRGELTYTPLQLHTENRCDAVGPVSWQLAGGVLIVVASTPSTGCDVLCVQALGGHPPGDWAREGAFLCT